MCICIYIWVSLVAQLVKNPPAMQETPVPFLSQEDLEERDRLPTPVFMGFPGGSDGKESAHVVGDLGLIPGLGRSPEEGMATHSSVLAWRIQRSLVGYSPWGHKESDITEQLSTAHII